MNNKHLKTKKEIFKIPVSCNIKWDDIESLFASLGAEITDGAGSRICIVLKGRRSVFHRPHPRKEASKGTIMSVRRFLNSVGIYDEI
jgi:hypothetical protein